MTPVTNGTTVALNRLSCTWRRSIGVDGLQTLISTKHATGENSIENSYFNERFCHTWFGTTDGVVKTASDPVARLPVVRDCDVGRGSALWQPIASLHPYGFAEEEKLHS